MEQVPEVRVKEPYHPPKLIVYGDLTQMTMTAPANSGMMEMFTGAPKT